MRIRGAPLKAQTMWLLLANVSVGPALRSLGAVGCKNYENLDKLADFLSYLACFLRSYFA